MNDFTEQGFLERMYLTRFYNQPFAANDKQSLSGIVSLCCYVWVASGIPGRNIFHEKGKIRSQYENLFAGTIERLCQQILEAKILNLDKQNICV